MKQLIVLAVAAVIIIGGAFLLGGNGGARGATGGSSAIGDGSNVSMVDGKQIIEIRTKGGYWPKVIDAKAGVPTVLRFNTSGTYDCSLALRIPSLGISKILPQTGSTDIDVGTREVGTLSGSCSMGMYGFQVRFN